MTSFMKKSLLVCLAASAFMSGTASAQEIREFGEEKPERSPDALKLCEELAKTKPDRVDDFVRELVVDVRDGIGRVLKVKSERLLEGWMSARTFYGGMSSHPVSITCGYESKEIPFFITKPDGEILENFMRKFRKEILKRAVVTDVSVENINSTTTYIDAGSLLSIFGKRIFIGPPDGMIDEVKVGRRRFTAISADQQRFFADIMEDARWTLKSGGFNDKRGRVKGCECDDD